MNRSLIWNIVTLVYVKGTWNPELTILRYDREGKRIH